MTAAPISAPAQAHMPLAVYVDKMKALWNRFWDLLDPHRKGPLFWPYGWKGILFIAAGTYFLYSWYVGPRHCPLASVCWLLTIGVHEAGHPIFRFLSGGNFAVTIWGGTLMEVGVPLVCFLYFLRKGREIQADICLLWLAMACYSVGQYTGCSLDPVISLLNAGPETLPDWDYMHKWLGTEGYEWQMRHGFYALSAFLGALGTYLCVAHFWAWNNPDGHDYNQDDDGHDRFFTRG